MHDISPHQIQSEKKSHTTKEAVNLQSAATVSTLGGEVAALSMENSAAVSSHEKRSMFSARCLGLSVLAMTGLPFSTSHRKETCDPLLLWAAPMPVTSFPVMSSCVPQGPHKGEKDWNVMLCASQKDLTPSGSGPMPTCHSC